MGKPRGLGPKIKKLHKQGYSYNEITEILNCSKGSVGYHLTTSEKERAKKRLVKRRAKYPLYRRSMEWVGFDKLKKSKNIWRARKDKNRAELLHEYIKEEFNNKCYISGRDLPDDFSKIELDHIKPVSKGGSNDISNMGPTLRHSNAMKSDMTMEELLELCTDVLEYHGRSVKKNSKKTLVNGYKKL
tara:strand:- start:11 stop:571 length:561 start_codon:yes stop_codon:yes gene_type:complete